MDRSSHADIGMCIPCIACAGLQLRLSTERREPSSKLCAGKRRSAICSLWERWSLYSAEHASREAKMTHWSQAWSGSTDGEHGKPPQRDVHTRQQRQDGGLSDAQLSLGSSQGSYLQKTAQTTLWSLSSLSCILIAFKHVKATDSFVLAWNASWLPAENLTRGCEAFIVRYRAWMRSLDTQGTSTLHCHTRKSSWLKAGLLCLLACYTLFWGFQTLWLSLP